MISEFKERLEKRHERSRELKKDGKKIVACFYGLVPKELVHAAGIVPIQLIEERNPQYEEKSELLPYLCGMSKNLTGQIYGKVFDYVDGVMVGTVCDTNRHVYDIWAHRKLFPHLSLRYLGASKTFPPLVPRSGAIHGIRCCGELLFR